MLTVITIAAAVVVVQTSCSSFVASLLPEAILEGTWALDTDADS
jgi:hypothetical protein